MAPRRVGSMTEPMATTRSPDSKSVGMSVAQLAKSPYGVVAEFDVTELWLTDGVAFWTVANRSEEIVHRVRP